MGYQAFSYRGMVYSLTSPQYNYKVERKMPAGEYQKTCLFQAYEYLFPAGNIIIT
jgi:hypothetical protein